MFRQTLGMSDVEIAKWNVRETDLYVRIRI